jgi:serine/threonine protein kinase
MNSMCSFIPSDFLEKSSRLLVLGEGTFGSVGLYDTPDGRLVIKETKMKNKSLGYPPDFLSEVDMLIKLKPIKSVVTIHSVCFDNKEKKGYILLEPLECNLATWSKNTSFDKRMNHIVDIISMIGGAIGTMHHYSFIHNDMKSNNILVDTSGQQVIFKLADFGKSYHVTDKYVKYGGVEKYLPPYREDVYTSELWGFMVSLVEVILGGKRMVKLHSTEHFYNEYITFSSKRHPRFDLPRYLRDELSEDEFSKIPNEFWLFVEPIIRGKQVSIEKCLHRIGIHLNPSVIVDVGKMISKKETIHSKFRHVEGIFKRKLKYLDLLKKFDSFSRLFNKFLANIHQDLSEIDLLSYAEVAFIIVTQRATRKFEYFKNQEAFLLYQRAFLVTIGYQIIIL